MGSLERSKKKVQLWKKAIVHFLLCFVMGFFTGFAPTGKGTITTRNINVVPKTPLHESNQTHSSLNMFNQPLSDETPATTTTTSTTMATVTSQWSELNETRLSKKVLAEEEGEEGEDEDQEPEEANDEFLNPGRLLIIVTPTSAKDGNRGILLKRLSNTLKLIPQPVLWIVVEQQIEDSEVSEILRKTGIMYRHLVFKENFTSIHEEVDHQRNVALNHIEHHRLSGIVHFASLSNVYDLTFFDELRAIEGFGTWPMALLSANKKEVIIEGPVCDSSEVMGWHLKKSNNSNFDERPPIRVSNFAFNTSILWDPERWGRTSSIQDTSQVAPLVAGLAIAAAAYASRYGVQAWKTFKAGPSTARIRKFYEGGFQPKMNRREAALILGVRESIQADKVREAHRKVMIANHPDAGGSHYLASKINEAKDTLLGQTKDSGSAF